MISRRIARLLLAIFCISALTVGSAYAAKGTKGGTTGNTGNANAGNNNKNNPNQQKDKEEAEEYAVLKFEKAEKTKTGNHEALVVFGVKILDGKAMQIPIPNQDPKSGKFNPVARVSDETQNFKAGDYARVTMKKRDRESYLTKIEKYDFKVGEDQPGIFKFVENASREEGAQEYNTVQLEKLGIFVDTLVPLKQVEKGKKASDPNILEKVAKLKKDDLVEVEVQTGGPMPMLNSIELVKAPEAARMKKVGESELDGQAKYPTVELDQYGKDLSYPVAGKIQGKKMVPDARVISQAKGIKPGTDVLVRTTEENGKTFVREIKVAPKGSSSGKTELKSKAETDMENQKDGKDKTAAAK